jgi:hypothetical protein
MKKRCFISVIFFGQLSIMLLSCANEHALDPIPNHIDIVSDTTPQKLSHLVGYAGSLNLKSVPYKMAQIDELMISDSNYILFDSHRGQQEKIFVLDRKSGDFRHEIFIPKNLDGDLSGVRSVCYDSKRKKIYALAFNKLFEFEESGKLTATFPINLNGSRIVVTEEGNLLVESSPNSKDDAHYHHLVLLDTKGRILKRFLPYQPQGRAFVISEMGLLRQTDKGIFYSKPFGDTIFTVKNGAVQPLIALDFGGRSVSRDKALNLGELLGNGGLSNRGYIKSDLQCIGDLVVFSYLNPNSKISFGFYDLSTGKFMDSRHNADKDLLAKLMSFGKVLGKDGNQLVFELTPRQAKTMIKEHAQALRQMKKSNPTLFNSIHAIHESQTTGLIYFNLTQDVKP